MYNNSIMSYSQYQRACRSDPQPLEFNNVNIINTIAYHKLMDPLEYKYACRQQTPQKVRLVRKGNVIEKFDFAHDIRDYNPPKPACLFTVAGSYLCTN